MARDRMQANTRPDGVSHLRSWVAASRRSAYPDPVVLRRGDEVVIGGPVGDVPDSEWPGWLWCTDSQGRRGWVPESYVERACVRQGIGPGEQQGVVLRGYDATELSVEVGEVLALGQEEAGWYWCANERGEEGWVPSENLGLGPDAPLPPGANRLYLVRHGENQANLTKEFSHRLVDYSLTDKGVLQARQTAAFFVDKDIDEVYTSPLKRAVETATILGEHVELAPIVVEAFREIDVGDLERLPPSAETWARHNCVLEAWLAGRHDVSMPGGEDYYSLWGRMRAALVEILAGKEGRNVVVVGHGGMFVYTLGDLCPRTHVEAALCATTANCSISEVLVELRDRQPVGQLLSWGVHDHLSGYAADLVPGTPDGHTFS